MLWLKTRKSFNNFSQQRSFLASAQRIGGNGVQGWSQNFIFEKVKKIYFKIQQGEKCLKRDIAGKENLLLSFSIFYQVISCGSYMTGEQRHDCREFVWTLFKTKDEWDGSSKWKVGEAEHLSGFSPLCFSQGRLIKLIFWSFLLFDNMSNIFKTSHQQNASTKCTLAFKDLSC